MSRLLCLFCFATVFIFEGIAQNLNNVDVLEPVVRISPDRDSPTIEGRNDYFGWSAILHASDTLDTGDTIEERLGKLRIMIGAPWGTYNGSLELVDPFEERQSLTGLVYNCPLTPGECGPVRGDTSLYIDNENLANNVGTISLSDSQPPDNFCEGRLFDQAPNATGRITMSAPNTIQFDGKRGQLLGSVLYSTGDIFVACAPRWQFRYNTGADLPRGICYWGGRDLTGFRPLVPCTAGSINSNSNSGTSDAFCLGGTDIVVNNDNFVLSAPGHSGNRGILASITTGGQPSGTPFTTGAAAGSSDTPDQYLGFQVINAYITTPSSGGSPPNLVASVPRHGTNYYGQLVIYTNSSTVNTIIETDAAGTQMGEFFGYSLAAGDLNNDGFDEVLVGAPMYSSYSTNAAPLLERGQVYIFRNMAGTLSGDRLVVEAPLSMVGGARARFGTSVAFLGDIDNDGYNDFIVGAPYLRNEGSSDTGAVFIYYGRGNVTEIGTQTPYMITASTLRSNVVVGPNLLTFGWSLFSGYDVDNNGYNDVIVGAYESQAVFVLRSLPVADINVTFVPHDVVDVDSETSFELTVMAQLNGISVDSSLNVNFELREEIVGGSRRVFFDSEKNPATVGMGTFAFTALNTDTPATVTIYTEDLISDFSMYMFSISLLEIERNVAGPVSGNQAVTSLSSFPRLRHLGETRTEVGVEDVCGEDGCNTDVMFNGPSFTELLVVANGDTVASLDLSVRNSDASGIEPASQINLVISELPAFVLAVTGVTNTNCDGNVNNNTVTCRFNTQRLNPGETYNVTIAFRYDTGSLIGNEMQVISDLQLLVPATRDSDSDTSNNGGTITFTPIARANLGVTIEFSPPSGTYAAIAPSAEDLQDGGVSSLGNEITLIVNVSNAGPSTIRNGALSIFLPSSDADTNALSLTYLYPYDIRVPTDRLGQISCDRTNLDTSNFNTQTAGRRRRSTMTLNERRAMRAAREVPMDATKHITRNKRQEIEFDLDCTPGSSTRGSCTEFVCSLTDFPLNSVVVTLNTRIDDRYFSTLTTRAQFNLRAYASVTINDDFIRGDADSDNTAQTMVQLGPFVFVEDQGDLLIHVILWPVLGGLLILVLLIIVLYFCGFFRRKRKPVDGEIEGDFDAPPAEGGAKGSYSPQQEEQKQGLETKPDEVTKM